jgi:hypothetical protein
VIRFPARRAIGKIVRAYNSTTMNDKPFRADGLRVSLQERDLADLMERYPKLTRTEIADVISGCGPLRNDVEEELERLSLRKR